MPADANNVPLAVGDVGNLRVRIVGLAGTEVAIETIEACRIMGVPLRLGYVHGSQVTKEPVQAVASPAEQAVQQ